MAKGSVKVYILCRRNPSVVSLTAILILQFNVADSGPYGTVSFWTDPIHVTDPGSKLSAKKIKAISHTKK